MASRKVAIPATSTPGTSSDPSAPIRRNPASQAIRRTPNSTWHPEDVLEIHPADAEVRGIRSGDVVELASRVGATRLTALVSERMPAGVVYTTFHHPVSGANVVTTENSDWATNCPEYKVTAVQVVRVESTPDEPARQPGEATVPVR